jgi:HK97 family phage portal protein
VSLFRRRTESRAISASQVFGTGLDVLSLEEPLSLVPLFACHRVIIDAVASTPLHLYRDEPDGSKRRLRTPSLVKATDGTTFSWTAQLVASLLYDGNAFGYIAARDWAGWPSSIVWLDPKKCQIEDKNGLPVYHYDGRRLDRDEVVHIPWIQPVGSHRGLSPVGSFKAALETGAHAQATARDWFANGAIPSGHVKNTQMTLDPAQSRAIRERFKSAVRGREPLVTGSDWEYNTIGLPADQAQFLAALKMSATQLASIYGVPPEEVGGETGNSLTYKTLEQTELRFNARVVRPWAVRIEQHLSQVVPGGQYFRFNLDANVRADLMTRYQAHEIGLRIGIETQDEARLLEDRAPLTPAQRDRWVEDYAKVTAPAAEGDDDEPTD